MKTLRLRYPGPWHRDVLSAGTSSGYISRKYCQGLQHWDLGPGCIIAMCPQGFGCHTATCPQVNSQPDPQTCRCRTQQFKSHHSDNQRVMLWHWVCHRDTCPGNIAGVCCTGIWYLGASLGCVLKALDVILQPARRSNRSLIHRHAVAGRNNSKSHQSDSPCVCLHILNTMNLQNHTRVPSCTKANIAS